MPPEAVEQFAPAKINLALHVLRRRPDNYHDLDTLAVFADVGDRIAVTPAESLSVSVAGALAGHAPTGGENLAIRAAELLKEHTRAPHGAAIRLEKQLPAGAGLGGGSADAAATLCALNRLWSLGLGLDELIAVGRNVGADVAMCLVGRALRAGGTGDRIKLRPRWPALRMVLVWPGRPVSTPVVFAALRRRDNPPLPPLPDLRTPAELAEFLAGCRNDLEEPARVLVPEIGAALQALAETPGCLLARMSGSGSACFGLYADAGKASAAAALIGSQQAGWWVVPTLANAART